MTSTSFNVGLTETTRLSSRVLRPPGGGHTDIFGGEPEPTRGRRPAPAVIAAQQSELQKQANEAEVAFQNGKAEAHHEPPAQPEPQAPPPQREEKAQSPVKTESAPVQMSQPEPPKAEAPKRVRVPPGGFSSGLW